MKALTLDKAKNLTSFKFLFVSKCMKCRFSGVSRRSKEMREKAVLTTGSHWW